MLLKFPSSFFFKQIQGMAVIDSQVVQLFCMLLFITIVSCFFIYHYSKGKDISDPDAKIQRLHTFYIAGILVFLVIELITSICMGNSGRDEILRYVSFAATVSSLIMSVVAIIITIVFSNRSSEQFGKLDTVTDDVKGAVDELKHASKDLMSSVIEFSGKSQSIEDRVKDFQTEASSLQASLSDIIDRLCKIEDKTDKTYEATMGENSPKGGKTNKGQSHSFKDFVSHCSFAGTKVLYACALSHETGVRLSLDEVSDGEIDMYYMYGYLIACQASGFVRLKSIKGERSFDVISIPENMKELVLERLNTKIASFEKDSQGRYKEMIKKIESYFKANK